MTIPQIMHPSPLSVSILSTHPQLRQHVENLAVRLNLPFTSKRRSDYILALTPERLELRDQREPASGGPVFVDFTSGKLHHRKHYGGGRQQALAKAIGLHKTTTLHVLDATAGLGQDSFVLATLGCTVTLLERSPIIAALLEDGLQRAALNSDAAEIAARMHLINTDTHDYLMTLKTATVYPDVIYLDPMYPERKKSALAKKEMRMLRDIVGDDGDTESLLAGAQQYARKRVVVKRPRLAPPLAGHKPSYHLEGKTTRYDIYISGV